jgi:hypothetical protein
MPHARAALISDYEALLKTQLADGNWNADPYMHGMANGMIMFHSMAVDATASPEFLTAPQFWKSRLWRNVRKLKQARKKLWLYFQWAMSSIISKMTGLEFEFPKHTLIKYSE